MNPTEWRKIVEYVREYIRANGVSGWDDIPPPPPPPPPPDNA